MTFDTAAGWWRRLFPKTDWRAGLVPGEGVQDDTDPRSL